MADRVMEHTAGRILFAWNIVSRQIEVYHLTETGKPERRLGWILAEDADGRVIDFEREPFEALCNEFLEMAAAAEVRDETGEPDGD